MGNKSWRKGQTPAAWREVILIGIPKPIDSLAPMPISISSLVNRVSERLVCLRLNDSVESVLLLVQAGFCRFRSTHEQIVAIAQRTYDCMSRKEKFAALFIKFSAAYDRVVVPAMLHKMSNLKCDPNLLL